MVWFIIGHLFATLLAWIRIGRLSESEKDLELLVVSQQLAMLERDLDKPVRTKKKRARDAAEQQCPPRTERTGEASSNRAMPT